MRESSPPGSEDLPTGVRIGSRMPSVGWLSQTWNDSLPQWPSQIMPLPRAGRFGCGEHHVQVGVDDRAHQGTQVGRVHVSLPRAPGCGQVLDVVWSQSGVPSLRLRGPDAPQVALQATCAVAALTAVPCVVRSPSTSAPAAWRARMRVRIVDDDVDPAPASMGPCNSSGSSGCTMTVPRPCRTAAKRISSVPGSSNTTARTQMPPPGTRARPRHCGT